MKSHFILKIEKYRGLTSYQAYTKKGFFIGAIGFTNSKGCFWTPNFMTCLKLHNEYYPDR